MNPDEVFLINKSETKEQRQERIKEARRLIQEKINRVSQISGRQFVPHPPIYTNLEVIALVNALKSLGLSLTDEVLEDAMNMTMFLLLDNDIKAAENIRKQENISKLIIPKVGVKDIIN